MSEPIKREETGPACLDEAELRLEIQQRGNVLAMEEIARQATEAESKLEAAQSQLTTLRTALDAAEGAVDKVIKRWIWFVNNPSTPIAGIASMDAAVEECQSALTLIKATKEVGE